MGFVAGPVAESAEAVVAVCLKLYLEAFQVPEAYTRAQAVPVRLLVPGWGWGTLSQLRGSDQVRLGL
jgi:hypothetical protein